MAQISGIIIVKVDGEIMRSKEGAKIVLGGKGRTAQVGHKVYGYTEKVVASSMEFTLVHTATDDLIALQNKVASTLLFESDIGTTFMIANAFSTKPAELTGGEGEVSYEFMGDPAEEV